jgi:hypothetical protein
VIDHSLSVSLNIILLKALKELDVLIVQSEFFISMQDLKEKDRENFQ